MAPILSQSAADLSTVNREALQPFFLAADPPSKPVTILSFGDSMANSYKSISYVLMNQFRGQLGTSGYSFNNYLNALNLLLTNGAEASGPSSFWFSTHYRIPPGGAIWSSKEDSPGGIFADHAGIFYVAHPAGGLVTVSVSTNAGPWAKLATFFAGAPTPIGRFVSTDLNPNLYRIRLESNSGTNIILGVQLLNHRSSGVNAAFIDYPGIGLDQVTNVPLSIRVPIFQALAPDLLIWHMKEDGSEATRKRLTECEQWWATAIPNSSVLYIGTPFAAVDVNSTWTIDQNTVVRSIATNYHHAYVDCMTPSISYDWMLAQNFMADTTHLNLDGCTYLAGFVWNDLGFFGLRVPRTLSCRLVAGKIGLSFGTVPRILYTLESRTDGPWQPLTTVTGNGLIVTTNFAPGTPSGSYRLRLEPTVN